MADDTAGRDSREVFVKNERRIEGDYSIYVREANSNMGWYTGMTFLNQRDCDRMVSLITEMWVR